MKYRKRTHYTEQQKSLMWDMLGRQYMGSEFVEFVDQMIAEEAATDELWTTTIEWTSQ